MFEVPILRACRNTIISAVPLQGSLGPSGLGISTRETVSSVLAEAAADSAAGAAIALCVGAGEPTEASTYRVGNVGGLPRPNLKYFLVAPTPADGFHRLYGWVSWTGSLKLAVDGVPHIPPLLPLSAYRIFRHTVGGAKRVVSGNTILALWYVPTRHVRLTHVVPLRLNCDEQLVATSLSQETNSYPYVQMLPPTPDPAVSYALSKGLLRTHTSAELNPRKIAFMVLTGTDYVYPPRTPITGSIDNCTLLVEGLVNVAGEVRNFLRPNLLSQALRTKPVSFVPFIPRCDRAALNELNLLMTEARNASTSVRSQKEAAIVYSTSAFIASKPFTGCAAAASALLTRRGIATNTTDCLVASGSETYAKDPCCNPKYVVCPVVLISPQLAIRDLLSSSYGR